MRLMIVGVGMMGQATAHLAVAELPLAGLHLVDVDQARVKLVAGQIARPGIEVMPARRGMVKRFTSM